MKLLRSLTTTTVLILFFQSLAFSDSFPTRHFSNHEKEVIGKGLAMYNAKKFSGQYGGGRYTDPNPHTRGYDFWSNGLWVKYDRDGNGHHETFFQIIGTDMLYVGTIGGEGKFIQTSSKTKQFLNRSYWDWVKTLKTE